MEKRRFLELVWVKTLALNRAESNKTYFGYFWWFLQPMIFMAVYYVVFAVILQKRTENFIAFLLIGLITFQWFSRSVMEGTKSIAVAKGLVSQTKIPKVIFPLSYIASVFWKFLFVFLVYIIVIFYFNFGLTEKVVAIPVLFLVQMTFIIGLTLPLAAIYPIFPDLNYLLETILRGFLFLSGVFFSGDSVPDKFKFYFYLNPMANLIEDYRKVIIYDTWPDWTALLNIVLFSTGLMLLGSLLVKRFDGVYVKYLQ